MSDHNPRLTDSHDARRQVLVSLAEVLTQSRDLFIRAAAGVQPPDPAALMDLAAQLDQLRRQVRDSITAHDQVFGAAQWPDVPDRVM